MARKIFGPLIMRFWAPFLLTQSKLGAIFARVFMEFV